MAAARRGDESAVRTALERDPRLIDSRDGMGLTALDWAATNAHWALFRELLAAGADVGVKGFDGGTVLHRLAHHDRPDLIRLLLDAGADPNFANQWGRTSLHVAARLGYVDVAELLVERGAELGATTREGWTPLHVAYRSGQPEMVRWLVAAGADENVRDGEGRLPEEDRFDRPPRWDEGAQDLWAYQGHYRVSDDFSFTVRVEDGHLTLWDFGPVQLYPTAPDTFFATTEPWAVRFPRDAGGTVTGIEVQFLRRVEVGTRVDAPEYVGSDKCAECHTTGQSDAYVTWLRSRHAAAYWRLATDWALFLARQRPHYQDVTDPLRDERCLNCHVTGALDELALFAKGFRPAEGIGCESCHGPGSKYIDIETMKDRSAFLAAGGRIPDEATCRSCHRDPPGFSLETAWPRIAHGRHPPREPGEGS